MFCPFVRISKKHRLGWDARTGADESENLLVVHGSHVADQVHHLVGIAALVVLSLSAKFPFKHLKTRHFRYNSHIIWDKVYSQDISQILSCFPRFIILGILIKS